MRVVFLNPAGELGGGERSLLDLLEALRRVDAPLDLHLVAGSSGPLLARAEALGVTCHLQALPGGLARLGDSQVAFAGGRVGALAALAWRGGGLTLELAGYLRRLRLLLRQLRPALIHSNGIKGHLLTGGLRQQGVPLIWHVRDFLGARPVVGRLLRWAGREVSLVLANSEAVADDARRVLPRVVVQRIYNGIDVGEFGPGPGDGARLDELAGWPASGAEVVRVGLPAAYARWKGQEVFIRAAARVMEERRELAVRYYIIGGPIYRTAGSQFSEQELRSLARAVGLEGRIGFIPFQEEMAGVYRALDVVVHASTRPEPFGRTIVEAMACARAVIVSQAGGAAELFTPEVDAVGVAPGEVVALAAAMGRLAADGGLRGRLGERARATAVERFDARRLGPELLRVYEWLVGRPGQGR